MSSERRLLANRANAQKSTGPKTEAGKARTSQNAIRHGLCATTFVCNNEDLDEYYELRNDYVARFGPRDQAELRLVDKMVHATWNQCRVWTMENEILNLQMFKMEGALAAEYVDLPERTRTALAFEELAKQPTLALLSRYESRYSNEYQRAFNSLLDLRKKIPLAPGGPPREARPQPPDETKPPRPGGSSDGQAEAENTPETAPNPDSPTTAVDNVNVAVRNQARPIVRNTSFIDKFTLDFNRMRQASPPVQEKLPEKPLFKNASS